MNPPNDPNDDELRETLRALGRENERRAPAFQRTWNRANTARRPAIPSWRLVWAVAVAVAVAIALCSVAVWPRKAPPVAVDQSRSDEPLPTDFLLTTNNDSSVDRLASEIDALLQP